MSDAASTSPSARLRHARAGFATSAGAMVVLSMFAAALNYASNLVFGRLLTPASYGDLTAMLAFVVIATVPTGAVQTIVAERFATLRAEGRLERVRYLIRHGAAHVMVISAVVGVVYAACIPLVTDVFGLAAIGPALATLPLLIASFFIPFAFGVLQGLERFAVLGFMFVGVAASRIIFGVPWTLAGGGAGGALAGQAIGNVCVVLAAWWIVREMHLPTGSGAARAGLRRGVDRRAIDASLAFIGFALLSNLDMLLAKAWLPSDESGYYAALVTLEKVVLFLPAAVAIVMVPNAARARHEEGDSSRILKLAGLLVTATVLVAALPASLAPGFVLETMFGDNYRAAESGVLPIVVAGAGLAMTYLVVVYTVTIKDHGWVLLLAAGVLAQCVGISLFHDSAAQVATVQAVVVGVVVLVNELLYHPLMRPGGRR